MVTNFSVAIFSTICITICIIYIDILFHKIDSLWQTKAQLHRSADRTLRNTLRALNGPWSLGLALAMEVCCQGWGVSPFGRDPLGQNIFHGYKSNAQFGHPTWVSRIVALALKNPPAGCHWHHCTAGKVRQTGACCNRICRHIKGVSL